MKNINALREQIAAVKSRIEELESDAIPVPTSAATAAADAYVDALVADASASLAHVSRYAVLGMQIPALTEDHFQPSGSGIIVRFRPLLAFTALLGADKLKKLMREQIAQHYADLPKPMSADERRTAIAAAKAELLTLERTEFAEVEAARSAGVRIEHRADVPADVLLGLN